MHLLLLEQRYTEWILWYLWTFRCEACPKWCHNNLNEISKCLIYWCRGLLGIKCLNFLNKGMLLFIIENFPFKFMSKFNLESNTRRSSFWDSEWLTSFPLKMKEEWMTLDFSLRIRLLVPFLLGQDWRPPSTVLPICLYFKDLYLVL